AGAALHRQRRRRLATPSVADGRRRGAGTMRWATAISVRQSLAAALDDAIDSLPRDFSAARADLALLFVSASHYMDMEMLPDRLQAKFPATVLFGCAAAGVIGGGREIQSEPAGALTLAPLPA